MAALMPSGIFSNRGKNFLVKHTRFIAIDIDFKDNLHITNYTSIKEQLSKLSCVAYCGLSVSGTGYWALIHIEYPDKHEEHFEFIRQYLAMKGLVIDPVCKNVDRVRYYSFDPDAYFNHSAKPLQSYYRPPALKTQALPQRKYHGKNKPVWASYNETDDFIRIMEKHGWKIWNKKGSKTYFTRPGKKSETSAEFDDDKRVLYVFSSNANPLEGGKGYSPFQVYTTLQHSGNFKAAAAALRAVIPVALKRAASKPVKITVPKTEPRVLAMSMPVNEPAINTTPAITKYNPSIEWQSKQEAWSTTINDLQAFLDTANILIGPIKLDPCTTITDVKKFVQSHMSTVRMYNGNRQFLSYLHRLIQLKNKINDNTDN